MTAIIQQGGKQYKVAEGEVVRFDKMSLEEGTKVTLEKVLIAGDKIGTPFVQGAKVEGEVLREGKDRKVVIYKKRRRKDSKLKKGFRREFTAVRITKISA